MISQKVMQTKWTKWIFWKNFSTVLKLYKVDHVKPKNQGKANLQKSIQYFSPTSYIHVRICWKLKITWIPSKDNVLLIAIRLKNLTSQWKISTEKYLENNLFSFKETRWELKVIRNNEPSTKYQKVRWNALTQLLCTPWWCCRATKTKKWSQIKLIFTQLLILFFLP